MGKNAQRRRRERAGRTRTALPDSLSVGTITDASRAQRRFRMKSLEMATNVERTKAMQRKRAGHKPRPKRGTLPWQIAQRAERQARRLGRRIETAA